MIHWTLSIFYVIFKIKSYMLNIIQIILAIPLITAILIQSKGSGLSGIFGGEGNVYLTKRGAEKTLFIFTIINAIAFFVVNLLNIIFF